MFLFPLTPRWGRLGPRRWGRVAPDDESTTVGTESGTRFSYDFIKKDGSRVLFDVTIGGPIAKFRGVAGVFTGVGGVDRDGLSDDTVKTDAKGFKGFAADEDAVIGLGDDFAGAKEAIAIVASTADSEEDEEETEEFSKGRLEEALRGIGHHESLLGKAGERFRNQAVNRVATD
jgi:hypothetical protein